MTRRFAFVSVALAFGFVAAQQSALRDAGEGSGAGIKGGDEFLVRSVRVVGERIAGIVRVGRPSGLVALRADEGTRATEALVRTRRLLAPASAAARGRAWRDLGFGSGSEPQELVAAIELDLPGMTFDGAGARLLVDPTRLIPDAGQGNPDEDADASILLATGVAPDEPVAGHYMAHVLLDGPSLAGPVTTDALLANAALAEGSANLAALVLLFGGVGLESEVMSGTLRPEDALGGRLVPTTMRTKSPVLTNLLEFVYLDGFAQAASLARKGGFNRVAQERRSRRTTRDVLHLDRPASVPIEIPEPTFPASFHLSPLDRDSLGEQGIIAMVSLLTGKDNLGLIAGDGWAADALWRFELNSASSTTETEGVTVWVTRWKTGEDAKDFVYALERCLQARFPGETSDVDRERGGLVLRRTDRVYRIEQRETEVLMKALPPSTDAKLGPPQKKKATAQPTTGPKK